jgi:hypothetical protein
VDGTFLNNETDNTNWADVLRPNFFSAPSVLANPRESFREYYDAGCNGFFFKCRLPFSDCAATRKRRCTHGPKGLDLTASLL